MSCREPLALVLLFCCLPVLAQDSTGMHHMQMQANLTGKAIPDSTASQLYLLSLSNLGAATLPHYFTFNLGMEPADVTEAIKIVRDFGIRYNDASKTYNKAIGEGGSRFTEALSRDLDANQSLAATEALENAAVTLSERAMKVWLNDIQNSKHNMIVADRGANAAPQAYGMGCCYNMTYVNVWNIVSASPPHVTLSHTVTVSGYVPTGVPLGITHHANITITKNTHNIRGSGPSVPPNYQINFSQTLTMDSNTDTCLLDGSLCNGGSDVGGATGSDAGSIFCSYLGQDVFEASVSSEEEAAFTQVFWPGESKSPATCDGNGSCDYLIAWDCTPSTTPPDDLITDIKGGDYRELAPNGVTWRTLAGCIRFVVTGQIFNFNTPWVCSPGLAFYISFNGQAPAYACTHNP